MSQYVSVLNQQQLDYTLLFIDSNVFPSIFITSHLNSYNIFLYFFCFVSFTVNLHLE
jgi:hypothetical protein